MHDLSNKELEALKHIRNSIIHNGYKPTYRRLMDLLNYQSPRSVHMIIRSLTNKGYLRHDDYGRLRVEKYPETIDTRTLKIPLVGNISCGSPNIAEQNIESYFCISTLLAKPPHKYFVLRTRGDSMDKKGIQNGSLVLIRQQPTARDGEIVAALIDNDCTLKEFYRSEDYIILKPNSFNTEHKPILLTSDFTILGVMIAVLPEL